MTQSYRIREQVNLAEYNSMGIAAKARYFVSVDSIEQLTHVLSAPEFQKIPKWILGGGSNVLFIRDFEGLVIHIDLQGMTIARENSERVELKVGAGENWHELVLHCVEKGWGGLENLSLIPGLVGAAPIQNIGAYGAELKDVFVELEALEIKTGNLYTFNKEECKFGYRDSIFKNEAKGKFVVTSVTIALQKKPDINTSYRALSEALEKKGITDPTIKQVNDAVIEIRESKLPDPAKIGNTGSFFKNPVISKKQFGELKRDYPEIPHYPSGEHIKIPAAWLIDQCEWKGKRFGDAGVHKMQALVIVNYGNATGEEIWDLALRIQASVEDKFGVSLVPEVNVVGAS